MSEREERLLEQIGEVRDELVEEAMDARPQKKAVWKRWGGLAAAVVLVAGVGYLLPRMGGSSGTPSTPGTTPGSTETGTSFMSYAGPVFPLTMEEENPSITAVRDVTLDFAPWLPVWISNESRVEEARANGATEEELLEYAADLDDWHEEGGYHQRSTDILVTDTYTLTNSSTEEQIVELCYPFSSSLRDYMSKLPSMTVNGSKGLGQVISGGYSGGFCGAEGWGSEGGLNLEQPSSWEDYKTLLEDGSYLEKALHYVPDFTRTDVVVYRFTDPWGPEEDDSNPNPSIRVTFDMDYDKTMVLSYGFHMGSFDAEHGKMGQGFSIPQSWQPGYGEPYYLVVLGEDIQNMETQGYNTGGWDTTKTVEFGVTIDRTETDLDTALRVIAELMYQDDWMYGEPMMGDFELYYAMLCDYLVQYGVLAETPVERYENGWLEFTDFDVVDRVFYLCQEVTIPAGGEVVVSYTMRKEASYDYHCASTENWGVNGYDLVTELGSNLTMTEQTATLEDQGQIEIVRDSFGFDLEQGVNSVTLNPDTEHYYLEVRHMPAT